MQCVAPAEIVDRSITSQSNSTSEVNLKRSKKRRKSMEFSVPSNSLLLNKSRRYSQSSIHDNLYAEGIKNMKLKQSKHTHKTVNQNCTFKPSTLRSCHSRRSIESVSNVITETDVSQKVFSERDLSSRSLQMKVNGVSIGNRLHNSKIEAH